MPIYMNYNNIPGDTTATGHETWIEVNSFQWGVGRGISSPTGGSSDREASAPSVSEIVVTKPTDVASRPLLSEALQGDGQDVTIDFVKTNAGTLETYLTFILNETMVSGYSVSSGGDRPQESLSLNFTQIEFKFTPMTAGNEAATPDSITYSIALGAVQ